jgi:hypothetical protein
VLCGCQLAVPPVKVTRTGSPVTGSAASITVSELSIAAMPSASIAHIEATVTPVGKVTSMPVGRAENG